MINQNKINAMAAVGEPEQCIASGQGTATTETQQTLAQRVLVILNTANHPRDALDLGDLEVLAGYSFPTQMWVVYTPCHGYDEYEHEQVHLICPDEATANACKDAINAYASALNERLAAMYVDACVGPSALLYTYRDQRAVILGQAVWPHSVNRKHTLDVPVCVKPLPFVGAA